MNQEPDPGIRYQRWAVGYAAAWFFFILLGYFVIRPVRDTMGSVVGSDGLRSLMWVTLVVMFLAVPAYAMLVARLPRRWLVRVVFHFFTACLIGFYFLMQWDSQPVQWWTSRVFFVWVNVFSLFATSVFWSVMADSFDSSQAKRLFGIVAAGGTSGAIVGSLLTSQIAELIPTAKLLWIPVVTIQAGLWCAWRLENQTRRMPSNAQRLNQASDQGVAAKSNAKPDHGIFAGIAAVGQSRYLLMICLFLFFAQALGTQLYFQQAEIVAEAFESKSQRVAFFSYLDLGTQLLTIAIQSIAAGWVLRRWGVAVALVLLPLVYFAVLGSLAVSPTLAVLVVAMILTRGVGYGMTVPSREVLFTVVSREDKYKSKSFIDTVVLRGADAMSGAIFAELRRFVTTTTTSFLMLPVVVIWGVTAWRLGRRQQSLADSLRKGDAS
ncbi:TLC ATP/ADP transporter [Rubripirellula obstinata]|uniref:TLC ATP/ADP transporter n=1 Tax=Rubripirellula obstinata TaxID=406547 RepID=A0A5B1CEW2_9BACT|nr:MFS transporter [Rubripirellula obstinata]KAA1258752.1 TLC ATP/ADP transporter [Rubripirellula obstinata]